MQSYAQAPKPATPPTALKSLADQLVDQLAENVKQYRNTLPSLAVRESIVSRYLDFVFFGKRVVTAEAILRATRKTPSGSLDEARTFTVLNGKPVAASEQKINIPIVITGPFADFTGGFFGRRRPCFTFVLAPHTNPDTPLELSFAFKPGSASLPQCAGSESVTAVARIDPATHRLIHLEQTSLRVAGSPKFQILFESVDLAPVSLGDKTFWLPTSITERVVVDKTLREWTARYSDYHQFAATSIILPATSE